jgi:PAS domain S-box-containing protein
MRDIQNIQKTLAAAGASGTWVWDIGTDLLHVDERFATLYGLNPEQALAGLPTATFFTAIHPDDRARIKIAVAGILAGAETFSKEFRIVAPDGAVSWVHGRGQGEQNDEEQPVRFSGLLVDVTERKRAEERLRIAQTAGGIGTFEYIDGYATVSVSEEFCRLLGLHPAQVLPVQTVNDVLQNSVDPLIPEPRGGDIPATLEAEFQIVRRDDGAHRWIARRGEILRQGAGYRLVGVIYDVTAAKEQASALMTLNETLEARVQEEVAERQQAEGALRQAYKMEAIGQLTGGIAHDFNNLLMAISSSLALLQKRIPQDPAVQRLIDNAQQGADRGAALTQRMLAFARRQDLTSERIDLALLVSGLQELISRTLGASWSLDLTLPGDLPAIIGDSNQLEMAILNLVVNARDAMPDGGVIGIEADAMTVTPGASTDLIPGAFVRLSVIDSGIGMDAETLARATEPFFTTKGVGKGTGLGLSMIHGLARQLEGTFVLHSEPGRGTTAELWLPASNDVAAQVEPARVSHFTPNLDRRLKILAVDDDVLILMNTAAMLEDLGHEVLEASTGAEALDLLRADHAIDLLITDQSMPNMLGTQLAHFAAEIRPDLPVILATGYGEIPTETRLQITKLEKPYTQALLAQMVEAVMTV